MRSERLAAPVDKIEFSQRGVANDVRDDRDVAAYLDDERDDRRSKTIVLKDDAPERVKRKVRGEAADSRRAEREMAGQVELTDQERREIDFSRDGVNVPKARSIKGIAANEGVDDWLAYADLELTVDENRSVLKRGKRQEGGQRMDARSEQNKQIGREARAYERQQREELEQAKGYAFDGDDDAREFVRERGLGELEIGFRREERGEATSIVGFGRDFERLEETHKERSGRAQTIDERRTASVTRDPFQWQDNPDKWDYPGIDTVDPAELHAERSETAREVDENEKAPIADSKQEWAMSPDEYDWPGVDTPGTGSAGLPPVDMLADRARDMTRAREQNVPRADAVPPALMTLAEERSAYEMDRGNNRPRADADDGIRAKDELEAAGVGPEAFDVDGVDAGDVLETDDQQALGGGRANDQARFAGGETGEVDTEIDEAIDENPGGVMEDMRDDVEESMQETEEMVVDAFQVREGGQGGLGNF